MIAAKDVLARMEAQQLAKFESVMAQIKAITKPEDMTDQLSTDIENLTHSQQAQADAAIQSKAVELGLV